MKNWRKERNYRKHENADGTFTYIITIEGVPVEVSAEIYSEYAKSGRKMEYIENDLKRNRVLQDSNGKAVLGADGLPVILPEREISLDKLVDEYWDFPSTTPTPEVIISEWLEIEMLYSRLDSLNDAERKLINALFFVGLTEREYAKALGISKTALHARKVKALAKLKDLFFQ